MRIRPITDPDIPIVAQLLHTLADEFILHESSAADAALFLRQHDESGVRAFIAGGMAYHVAEIDDAIAGFIAVRERSHVFHMFVQRAHHRKGIARALWKAARESAMHAGHAGAFTVNSSNHAVPVYEAMGFVRTAPMQFQAGLYFNPMRFDGSVRD